MTAIPFNPFVTYTDSSGNPLVGGKIFTYAAGTNTPLASYTDAGGTTPATNPIILDANGRSPYGAIWGSGAYKFVLADSSGSVIQTDDNITAAFGAGDMTKAVYDPANISQQVVGTTAVQTLTNKTLTSPVITGAQGLIQGGFKNLKIVTSGATIVITADAISLADTSAQYVTATSVSVTINTATAAGLLAIDTGSWATSTWYYVWVISNGTTTSAIASLSSTSPTMPGGYSFKARVGAVRSSSGSATTLLATIQYGRRVQYTVTGVSPNAGLPIMASGSAGAPGTPTWVAVATGSYVPATASVVEGIASNQGTGTVSVAPNNTYGANTSTSNPPHTQCSSGAGNFRFGMILESTNIYWASNNAGCFVACVGWEDNI